MQKCAKFKYVHNFQQMHKKLSEQSAQGQTTNFNLNIVVHVACKQISFDMANISSDI